MKSYGLWARALIFLMACEVLLPLPIFGQSYEYEEIRDPAMSWARESMRAHQIQFTMMLFYTSNVDTPGYLETNGFNRLLKGENKVRVVPFYRWRAGPIVETGRELDFALDAESRGFFTIQLPNAEGYTRDGRFTTDRIGRLVMVDGGYPVLGENGIIFLPEGGEVTSATSGLLFADGDAVDKLKIAVFPDESRDKLVDLQGSIFVLTEPNAPKLEGDTYYKVRQGFIEQNNVLKAIVGDSVMLKAAYEGTTKVAKVTNRTMKSIVQLGAP